MIKTHAIGYKTFDIREPSYCSEAKRTYQNFAFLILNLKYSGGEGGKEGVLMYFKIRRRIKLQFAPFSSIKILSMT